MSRRPWCLVFSVVLLSCTPSAPSDFPDHDELVSAQKKWCATLAKLHGDKWSHTAKCEAATPTGAPEFLARLSKCYLEQVEDLQEHDVDTVSLRRQCTDMVLESWDSGDTSKADVIAKRCDRMERCQELPSADCFKSYRRLSPTQRSGLSAMYNQRAQYQVAQCLETTPCGTNEDAVHSACYDEVWKDRAWVP